MDLGAWVGALDKGSGGLDEGSEGHYIHVKFFFVVIKHTTRTNHAKLQVSYSNSLAVMQLFTNFPFFSVRLLIRIFMI